MNRLKSLLRFSTVWVFTLTLAFAGTYAGCGGGTGNNTTNTTNNNNGGGTNSVNNNNSTTENNNNSTGKTDECNSDGDCPPGKSCKDDGGVKKCLEDSQASVVEKVEIVNGGGVIRKDGKRTLEAIALNKAGVQLPGPHSFKWSSDKADSVAVNETSGEITGGSASGEANIKVELDGKSASTKVNNFGDPTGTRAIVLDNNGQPVEGATVKIGSEEGKTDANGVVDVTAVSGKFDIHIFHKDYNYFSAFGVTGNDFFIEISKASDPKAAGGAEGDINFDPLQSLFNISGDDWPKYNVEVGIVGLSLSPSALLALDFDLLLGESVPSTIPVVNQEVDLPQGVLLSISGKGKPSYKAVGQDGRRAMWGFGGKFQITELLPLIPADTKNINIAEILVKAKPLLEKMAFGMNGNIVVQGGKVEKKTLSLSTKLSETLSVEVKSIPTVKDSGGKEVDLITIGLAGRLVPGIGLAPTGITFEQGKGSATLSVKHAKAGAPLDGGKFALISLALTLPLGDNPPPLFIFGDVQVSDTPPSSATVNSFVALPSEAKFDVSSRALTKGTSADADMYHFTFSGKSGKTWTAVYAKGTDTFTLPAVPSGMDDPVSAEGSASFRAVKTKNGATLDSILQFNGTNWNNLVDVLAGFCNLTVYEQPKP